MSSRPTPMRRAIGPIRTAATATPTPPAAIASPWEVVSVPIVWPTITGSSEK